MIRVLLVDDEPGITRSLSRLLRGEGFEVVAVNDPTSALERLRAEPAFALVISDERMPGGSGVDFLEACASEWPSTVRVLLTGQADARMAAEAVNRGEVFRFLWKPWDDEKVIAIVHEAAWRHSLLVESQGQGQIPAAPDEQKTPTVPMLRLVGEE